MAGDFDSIIQGVVAQGTALSTMVRQTAQDITASAYDTYTDSLAARIATAKIQASQDLTNTDNTSFLDEAPPTTTVSPNITTEGTTLTQSDSNNIDNHNDDDDDDDDNDHGHKHHGWGRHDDDDHRGWGRHGDDDHHDGRGHHHGQHDD